MRIACVSDVCIGYGSPQIGYLTESLRDHYGADALIVEPRVPALAPQHHLFPGVKVLRAQTGFDVYSEAGRIEYVLQAARMIDQWAPDLLVLCCTFTIPVLFKLKKRPRHVIYFSYESIAHYGDLDEAMNGQLRGEVDLVIFPEENRAAMELGRYRFGGVPIVVLYNCVPRYSRRPLPKTSRNGRFLYAGTIDRVDTLAEYYATSRVDSFPIDLYGPIRGGSDEERESLTARLREHVRYGGHVDSRTLSQLRPYYVYSLVAWNPRTENQLYAAPNKLFESIADGVPPLTAPHPQCKKIVERYSCGLLLSDWTEDALVAGLERASRIYRTSRWDAMVSACEAAFVDELNWERQFEKLKIHLGRLA